MNKRGKGETKSGVFLLEKRVDKRNKHLIFYLSRMGLAEKQAEEIAKGLSERLEIFVYGVLVKKTNIRIFNMKTLRKEGIEFVINPHKKQYEVRQRGEVIGIEAFTTDHF